MPNPVVHFEIQSNMAEKLQPFYTDLFGWHIDANNPMNYGMVDTHAEEGLTAESAPREAGEIRSLSTCRWMTCRLPWIRRKVLVARPSCPQPRFQMRLLLPSLPIRRATSLA